jgi:hypothetical protein
MICPNCKTGSTLNIWSTSILNILCFNFAFEIMMWFVAGTLIMLFSYLDLTDALGIAILIVGAVAILLAIHFIPNCRCSSCNKCFTLKQLKTEYNKSLQSDARKDRAPLS